MKHIVKINKIATDFRYGVCHINFQGTGYKPSPLGKLSFPLSPDQFIPKERKRHLVTPLDLSEQDTLHLCKLPTPHKDPFDRMLVCQAIEHSLIILTPDPLITQYPIRYLW